VIVNSYNPRVLVKRLSFLYAFLTRSLKAFLEEAITDPKRLRKYFSYQGILRILADFTSAGYKQSFQEELRMSLLRRGLIVEAEERNAAGRVLLAAAFFGIACTVVIAFAFTGGGNWAASLIIWTTSFVVAFTARALWLSRKLVPLYEELAVVGCQVKRKSFRLEILIFILRSFNIGSSALIVFVSLILIGTGLLLARLSYPSIDQLEIIALLGFLLAHLFIAQIMFESFSLSLSDYPTTRARNALASLKRELTDVSPLDAFKSFLNTPDYDPTLSKLVAIYGIETLLIFV
ncbi:MAG: hypothetical protein K8F91_18745, partial [Candidatus Obscuribacterales bacterium]|nr:hypothetical protein [Candidatus Obscuribacterales bacterium]